MNWVLTGMFLDRYLSLSMIDKLGAAQLPVGVIACASGSVLVYCGYRAQVTEGRGHPFDLSEGLAAPTQKLLKNGVYYWSRNPMNLGDMLLYGGLSVIVGSDSGVVVNLPFYYLLVWANSRIRECPGLIRRFGGEYREYEQNTSCIIPGPRTLKKILFKKVRQFPTRLCTRIASKLRVPATDTGR